MSESRPAVAQNPPRVVVPAGTTAGTAVREAGLPGKGSDAIVVVKDAEGHLRDLSWTPQVDVEVEAVAADTEDGRSVLRHSAAHVLDHAFNERDLHRVDLEVYDFNDRAIHVYKKLGFREEGRLRDALLWDGEFYDAIVMSVLSTDNI